MFTKLLQTLIFIPILNFIETPSTLILDDFLALQGTLSAAELNSVFSKISSKYSSDSSAFNNLTIYKQILFKSFFTPNQIKLNYSSASAQTKALIATLTEEFSSHLSSAASSLQYIQSNLILSFLYYTSSYLNVKLKNLSLSVSSINQAISLISAISSSPATIPAQTKTLIQTLNNKINSLNKSISICNEFYTKINNKMNTEEKNSYSRLDNYFSEVAYRVPHSAESILVDLEKSIYKKCPRYTELVLIEAKINYYLRNPEQTKTLLLEIILKNNRNDEALFYRGLGLLEEGKFKESFIMFSRAFQEDESNTFYKQFNRLSSELKKIWKEADTFSKQGKSDKEAELLLEYVQEKRKEIMNNRELAEIFSKRICVALKESADEEESVLEKALEWCNKCLRQRKTVENIDNKLEVLIAMERYKDADKTIRSAFNFFVKVGRNPKKYKLSVGNYDGSETEHYREKLKELKHIEKNKDDDLFRILGVKENATQDEIKRQFRKLSLKYHPDRCVEERKAFCEKKISKINRAYEILKDKEKRKEWEHEKRFGGGGRGRGHPGGFDFSDFFGGATRRRRRGSSGSQFSFSFG